MVSRTGWSVWLLNNGSVDGLITPEEKTKIITKQSVLFNIFKYIYLSSCFLGCHSQQPACGRAVKNSRIIEGQDATPGSWPWHAIVVTYGPYGYNQCGGSLITNQWVLTAAQCLPSSSYNTVVHLGRFNQSGSNPNEQTQKVENIVCYSQRPNYDYDYYDYYYYYWPYNNDICLLKLSAPVIFTDYIQPICLSSTNSTFYNGTSSWVTGFGYDNYYPFPNILQEVNVPILGNNECRCYLRDYNYWIPKITENVTCTGPKLGWKGPCKGDEGEPLMMKAGSIWIQIGITSYSNCRGPSIYTRVSQYQKWISDTVTGTPPGFVTFSSPGADSDSNFTCSTSPPTTIPAPLNTTVSTPLETTVSTPLNTTVSTPLNTTVSTPLNTTVSTPFISTVSTPLNTTVSTPLNTTVSTPFISTVSTPLNTTVSTPFISTVSTPLNTTVSTPLNTTVSTPLNTTVSTPFISTVSTRFNTTVIPTTRNNVENLTHFTHFTSLCVLVVLLHLFGGSGM
ncbi:serine protease 48-like [Simochromis diagramma]|uniref:serine protease 48-like n=1 Tax=Simochromis diagramma TaxID=43689 RepID=UPI001A7E528A|nr:serine protease 48-like [Simochromis diagramma]